MFAWGPLSRRHEALLEDERLAEIQAEAAWAAYNAMVKQDEEYERQRSLTRSRSVRAKHAAGAPPWRSGAGVDPHRDLPLRAGGRAGRPRLPARAGEQKTSGDLADRTGAGRAGL